MFSDKEFSVEELKNMGIAANSSLNSNELQKAKEILVEIHKKTSIGIKAGKGPFYAEIHCKNGVVCASSNSVVEENCSICHAEINAIKEAHRKFQSWALDKEELTIYINAEPCIMCLGAIMWSGIKRVFYSVPSCDVEKITGFDEGFKAGWMEEFKARGIKVFGNIEAETGKKVLCDYVNSGCKIYKPR